MEIFKLNFTFPVTQNKRSLLLKVVGGSLQIEDRILLDEYNLQIYYGDRLQIAGENGVGKTLLIKNILSRMSTTDMYKQENLKVACLDQFYEYVDRNISIYENVFNVCKDKEVARKILSLCGFKDKYFLQQKARVLSGGEMCRLSLAKLSVSDLDMVVLDEPTNNLDIETKEVLVNCINKFTGALVIISHDQDFISKIKIQKVLEIKDKKLREKMA